MNQFGENHFGQMKPCQCDCRRKEEKLCPSRHRDKDQCQCGCKNASCNEVDPCQEKSCNKMKACQCDCRRKEGKPCSCRRRDEDQCQCRCKNAGCNEVNPCQEKSCNQCESCCSPCCVCCQDPCEPIKVNMRVFNASTLAFTITQGDNQIEHAVSFSAFGIDFPESIFPKPRTISGVIRADGTIYSGEGFRVSHRKGTGYLITFDKIFGAVDQNKPPTIQIVDEPVNGPFSFPVRSFGENVGETISGLIDSEGKILDGTMLQNSDEYAFTVRRDPNIPGLFRVKFKAELKVTYVFTDPYSSNIRVFDLEAPQFGCCCNCSSFGNPSEPVIGQGVDIVMSNSSGFDYRTYEETTVRRRYTGLPVVFNILVIREK